jgi:hypothetical protein
VIGASSFHLLDFASPELPTVGWYEVVTAAGIITDENEIRNFRMTYAEAFHQALNRADSAELIRERRSSITGDEHPGVVQIDVLREREPVRRGPHRP